MFSDYEVAKRYTPPYPEEKEPGEYIGFCWFDQPKADAYVRYAPDPDKPDELLTIDFVPHTAN